MKKIRLFVPDKNLKKVGWVPEILYNRKVWIYNGNETHDKEYQWEYHNETVTDKLYDNEVKNKIDVILYNDYIESFKNWWKLTQE